MKNHNRSIIIALLVLLVIASAVYAKSLVENNFFAGSAVAQRYPYLQPFPLTSPQQQSQNAVTDFSNGNSNNNNNRLVACTNQPFQKEGTIPPFCGRLTVIKQVQGGTALPSQFVIQVNSNYRSRISLPGSSSGTAIALLPGLYQVTERLSPGYTPSLSVDCSGIILPGQSKTCIITNTLSAASLTVIKHVINDNGGTRTAKDFTISVSGNKVSPRSSFAGAESPGTSVLLSPGMFSVSETGPSGYTQSVSGDCSGNINAGESKTCMITNDDSPEGIAHLKVIKHVDNTGCSSGCSTASDFGITVNGIQANPNKFQGSETGTTVALKAGTYTVDETFPPNSRYSGSESIDCRNTISEGQTKTCIITNTFISPT